MRPTDEQEALIYCIGNAKCIAVAGSGKSTTLMHYALKRSQKRGLYIVYNNSARAEGINKAKAMGVDLDQLHIHTAHSFALKSLRAMGQKFKIQTKGMDADEIISRLALMGGDQQGRYTIAKMIQDGMAAACNRMDGMIYEWDFKDYNQHYVRKYFGKVVESVNYFLREMKEGYLPCSHDFYLKLFAKQSKQLGYDYILFDEGQDANEVMLHIFDIQKKCTRVIVGDPSQQIYSWRGAVNALDKVNFPSYNLTASWRFGPVIARDANNTLLLKKKIGTYGQAVLCKGMRPPGVVLGQTAYLCRSNVGLFKKMVTIVHLNPDIRIYLEGGMRGNNFLSAVRLMSDCYWLFAGKKEKIKSAMIGGFKNITALYEFAQDTNNKDIKSMIDLIFTYKSEVFSMKDKVKARMITNREEADAYFSTVHKAKGQEYANVELDDTFINMEDVVVLSDLMKDEQEKKGFISKDLQLMAQQTNEELNCLYVGQTRAMGNLKFVA